MVNNIIKVSPRNRVDFTQLRKFNSGGYIQKFLNSGILHKEGTSWLNDIFSKFQDDIIKFLKGNGAKNLSDTEKQALVQEINELQNAYAVIKKKYPNLTPTQVDLAVKDYQNKIINKFNFVNQKGIQNGLDVNRYIFQQKNPYLRDHVDTAGNNNSWAGSADGRFSGLTSDRTLLGYGNDWNTNSEAFKNWQKQLSNLQLETYLDKDWAWKLRLLSTNPPGEETNPPGEETNPPGEETNPPGEKTNPPGEKTNPPGEETNPPGEETNPPGEKTNGGDFNPDEYPVLPNFKYPSFTAPLNNAVTLGLSLTNNKNLYDLDMQKKVPLAEALRTQFTAGNNKFLTDSYNDSAARLLTQAANIASQSSNLEQSLATQLLGSDQAEKQRMAAEKVKLEGYESDKLRALATANFNNLSSIDTANHNRKQLTSLHNLLLNDRQAYLSNKATSLNDFHTKNVADWGRHLTNKRQEYDNFTNLMNSYLMQKDVNLAYQYYTDLKSDAKNSDIFNNIYSNIENYIDLEDPNIGKSAIGSWLATDYDDTEEGRTLRRNDFYTVLTSDLNSDLYKKFSDAYTTELTNAYNKGESDYQKIMDQRNLISPTFKLTHTTLGYFSPRQLGQRYKSIYSEYKQGGNIEYFKTGSRVDRIMESRRKRDRDKAEITLKALENNRKATEHYLKIALQQSKLILESLKRELESLDRESLILLRSVFK